jgi:Helix-turn-helix domain
MSALLMGRVWQLDGLDRNERTVLLALADHAFDDGTSCRPGVPYLAWKTDLSERSVQRALRGLEEKDLIVPTAHREGGRGHVTHYELHLENGAFKSPLKGQRKGDRERTKGDRPGAGKGDTEHRERVTEGVARVEEPSELQQRLEADASSVDELPLDDRSNDEGPSGGSLLLFGDSTNQAENSWSNGRKRPRDLCFEALVEEVGVDPAQLTTTGRGAVNRALKELRQVGATPGEIHLRAENYRRTFPQSSLTAPALAKHWASLNRAPPPKQGGMTAREIMEYAEELARAGL